MRITSHLAPPALRASQQMAGRPVALAAVILVSALSLQTTSTAAVAPVTLVVCAPGYPGSTAEAQPAMDALAAAVAGAAGWKPGEFEAVYFETEKGGLDRLAGAEAALALVPLPFWLQHRAPLKLDPVLQAIQQGGEAAERWSLVAATGTVTAPASLVGFELVSLAGYCPRFIRGPVLGPWGELPPTLTMTFSGAVLTALRRAASGGKIAVLLDREQAAALPTLPFASKLEVVTRSAPLPVSVLCSVGGRLPAARLRALVRGFATAHTTAAGANALAGVRLSRFVPADQGALSRANDAYERSKE
jgi:hypothetical protein